MKFDTTVDGVSDGLFTPEDLIKWKKVAESNEMPWTFDDDFKIQFR